MARPQPRKERDNERLRERWRGPWARLIPRERSERIARQAYIKRPSENVFHSMENIIS